MPQIQEYPWASLPLVAKAQLDQHRNASVFFETLGSLDHLEAALAEVLKTGATLKLTQQGHRPSVDYQGGLCLEIDGTKGRGVLWLEAALVSHALGRVLGRPGSIDGRQPSLDPLLRGAVAAVACEVFARAVPEHVVQLAKQAFTPGVLGTEYCCVLRFDDRSYRVMLWVQDVEASAPRLRPPSALPIRLELVAAVATARRDELRSLEAGDAWLPGSAWWINGEGIGRGALCARNSELGVTVQLTAGGRIVLGNDNVSLLAEKESTMEDEPSPLDSVLEEAPVVVRVELASVTLTAKEWHSLSPGDIVQTQTALGEPAVLRVAGQVVGRGQLVSVDGELGVRLDVLAERNGA